MRYRMFAIHVLLGGLITLTSAGCCKLVPWALTVDPSLSSHEDGDAVLEPGETVVVEPAWTTPPLPGTHKSQEQVSHGAFGGGPKPHPCSTVTGTASDANGPPGASYLILDDQADYGNRRTCASTGNCYALFVSRPSARPTQHWDARFTETLAGASDTPPKTWTLHVGGSFSDVPRSSPFYAKIETAYHKGITDGCMRGLFCPFAHVSRGFTAMSLARAIAGGDVNIPDSGKVGANAYTCATGGASLFTDVDASSAICKHVHYIAARNVTLGCAPSRFCPEHLLSRLQMAALVAKSMVQPAGGAGVPLTYEDSVTGRAYSCDSASPNLHFADVPDTDSFCKHAHYLWARGVVAGCGPDQFCAGGDVTREEMAKFLVNAFQLKLYEP